MARIKRLGATRVGGLLRVVAQALAEDAATSGIHQSDASAYLLRFFALSFSFAVMLFASPP